MSCFEAPLSLVCLVFLTDSITPVSFNRGTRKLPIDDGAVEKVAVGRYDAVRDSEVILGEVYQLIPVLILLEQQETDLPTSTSFPGGTSTS